MAIPNAARTASTSSFTPTSKSPLPSTLENLIISQAVTQLGTADWKAVVNLLSSLDLVKEREKEKDGKLDKFTVEFCSKRFAQLIKDEGLDITKTLLPDSRPARKLARKFYSLRISELSTAIRARFEEESTLLKEIKEIQNGQWDEKILSSVPEDVRKTLQAQGEKGKGRDGDIEMEEDEEGGGGEDNSSSRATTPNPNSSRRKSTAPTRGSRKSTRGVGGGTSKTPIVNETKEESVEPENEEEEEGEGVGSEMTHSEVEVEEGEGSDNESTAAVSTTGGRKGRRRAAASTSKATGSRRTKRKQSEAPTNEGSPPVSIRSSKRAKTEETSEELPETSEKEKAAALQRFKRTINLLLDQLNNIPESHSFRNPVTRSVAPNYPSAIHRPLCLRDVSRRIKEGLSSNRTEVMRDVALVFANAVQFNGEEDQVARDARKVWGEFEKMMMLSEMREFSG